jgi:hypothetical protein
MTEAQDIRRHPDGSIDIDFYRAGTTALRRQAMRDAWKLRRATAAVLVTLGVVAVAGTITSTSTRSITDRMTAALSR